MAIAADSFARRERSELGRWGGSLLVVLALHVAVGLYLVSRQMALDSAGGAPPDAVMIDLAPLPAPPAPAPPEPVVEPKVQPQIVPAPPPPPLPEIPLPRFEPSPAPKPAVVLPKPPPKVIPKPVERAPEPLPMQAPPPPAAAAPPAPAPTPPAVNAGAARASWQAQLAGWLERYKRYPRLAQEQRQEGTVYLRFTMDRQGRVLSSSIDRPSGYALLDEEVAALIQRAQPLPAPPPEVPGAQITLSVPVQFSIRGIR